MPVRHLAHRPAAISIGDGFVDRWLCLMVQQRAVVLIVTVLLTVALALRAGDLQKDTSANAYIEPDNPALIYRERVVEAFGLKEPIVVAVRHSAGDGILNERSLNLVRLLVQQLEAIPNIDTDRITSLVSRNAIVGGEEGLDISPLLADDLDAAAIDRLRGVIREMPIYEGTLVSEDRTATIIAAELLDESQADATYRAVLDLTRSVPHRGEEEIFVAGAGAITGYFSSYIDRDASRLVPFAAIGVSVVLFFAFLTIRGSVLPMLIAVVTVIATLGLMSASHVPFYAISNGMVVVLIGISVAEPMHVFGEYYSLMRQHPQATNHQLVVAAMSHVWRPIALTSITTVGGFFSLWVSSTMPPIRYFGLFGAIGVVIAWVLAVTFLPASMAVLSKRPSRLMAKVDSQDPVSRAMSALGRVVLRWPRAVVMIATVVCGLALFAASFVTVDHARIENFNASEPLYIADREINRTLAGTNQLDIVFESDADDGILTPDALRRIDAVQSYLRSFPEVGSVTSIVDYIKQLNRGVDGGQLASWRIPDDPGLIAQLLLTYQASAPPTEFQSLIDAAGRTALVRTWLRADRWSEQSRIIHAVQRFLDQQSGDMQVKATMTGRVMLDYAWVKSVASGHALSVIASTITVWLMCIFIFRSFRDGLLCLVPLFVSVVLVYAAMGIGDIWLGVATSMFASVAIGLGIDFAIHMISRARNAARLAMSVDERIMYIYQSTGRAVLFNAAAVGLGFAIVTLSAAPPIRMFGVLVAIAIVGAFVAAVTVLPAILKLMGDRAARKERASDTHALSPTLIRVLLVLLLVAGFHGTPARAQQNDTAQAARIMNGLASRIEGNSADRVAYIRLIDRNGGIREQVARAVRKNVEDGRRLAIFYQSPANIRGTSFLVFDYGDARPDDQWLYLPALRKVRRVPASDRGDYFLGTDLTYDEVRNDNRVTPADWVFHSMGSDAVDTVACTLVEGTVVNEKIARELGYGRAQWCVDTGVQIARRIEYWDRAGQLLKTVTNRQVENIDGIWTALLVEVRNHKTGHRTQIEFRDGKFNSVLPDSRFTQQQLERGL